jgi:ABC-type uncharacterized transport system ATPase subunit
MSLSGEVATGQARAVAAAGGAAATEVVDVVVGEEEEAVGALEKVARKVLHVATVFASAVGC